MRCADGRSAPRPRPRWSRVLALGAVLAALLPPVVRAEEHVKISAFQGTFVNFPVYVANELGIFEKHGLKADLVYGTGIQVTNIMVSGAADFGAFAVEHGLLVISKGQDVKLLVVDQTLAPFTLIVRNDVPTPHAGRPFPEMLQDVKGLRIGVSTPGASSDQTLRFLLLKAGLDPQKDVKLVPVGAPTTQVAGLKNGLIDADMAFEPAQTEAVLGQKIAKPLLDIQNGEGPEIFREYAYNGVFARESYLKAHPDTARAVVASIVEAEQLINDPAHYEEVAKVATDNMRGIDPALIRLYVQKHRGLFTPIATPKAIANVNEILLGGKQIETAVPYERVVAADFMPREFSVAKAK
jgi:ABC-type nitrate/sulfonate/bicarbonate transport system substrate-binding protein